MEQVHTSNENEEESVRVLLSSEKKKDRRRENMWMNKRNRVKKSLKHDSSPNKFLTERLRGCQVHREDLQNFLESLGSEELSFSDDVSSRGSRHRGKNNSGKGDR